MPGMPYHLEKGPWLAVLEDYINGSHDRAVELLRYLRSGAPVADAAFFQSPALDDADYAGAEMRVDHMRRDWFGETYDEPAPTFEAATEALLNSPPALPLDPIVDENGSSRSSALRFALDAIDAGLDRPFPQTGFWHRFFGNVEEIVRITMLTALEVSFGISSEEEPPASGANRLPVEIFWKCPQRWFEGWVTWRYDAKQGNGQVTVMLATPGIGKPILQDPIQEETDEVDRSKPRASPPTTQPDPTHVSVANTAKGMWVISHKEHVLLPSIPVAKASGLGAWVTPAFGPAYVGVGPIVIVSPAERDGGVDPDGKKFIEPTGTPKQEAETAA